MNADPRLPAYFDSSALVKRYVAESGSATVRGFVMRHRVISSTLAPLEITSAVRRRHLEQHISSAQFADILAALRLDHLYWELTEADRHVLQRAEELLRSANVRTLDALHVCSAAAAGATLGEALPFITADRRQREAAVAAGLDVAWVE